MKKTITLFLITALALLLAACSGEASAATDAAPIVESAAALDETAVTSVAALPGVESEQTVESTDLRTVMAYDSTNSYEAYAAEDLAASESSPGMTSITLAGDSAS